MTTLTGYRCAEVADLDALAVTDMTTSALRRDVAVRLALWSWCEVSLAFSGQADPVSAERRS